jgi:hypothetical protein
MLSARARPQESASAQMLTSNPWDLRVFVLVSFAVWRFTSLIVYDSGPFDVMTRLRRRLVRARLGVFATCFDCVSIWVSIALVTFAYSPGAHWLVLVAAVAGVTQLLELRYRPYSTPVSDTPLIGD